MKMYKQITIKRDILIFEKDEEVEKFLANIDPAKKLYEEDVDWVNNDHWEVVETLDHFISRVMAVANTLSEIMSIQYLDDKTAFIIHREFKYN